MRGYSRIVVAVAVAVLVAVAPGVVGADEGDSELWPPMPGVGLKAGVGTYYSVPCGCFDRRLVNGELSARLHFGHRGAVEADIQRGSMLLGGRFPSQAWSIGGRVNVLPNVEQWWDGLSVRLGYRRWQTMGMRTSGTHGVYGALNWAVEVLPHVYVEADALGGRTFVDMPHWHLGARLGVATRF